MATRIEAYVLLNGSWKPDAAEFAAVLEARYPGIGRVEATGAEEGSGRPHVFSVDGAAVQMSIVNAPYPPEQLTPPLRLVEHVDPEVPARMQVAYAILSAEWTPLEGEDAARANAEIAGAYNALLTLLAATVASEAPSVATFWAESWRIKTEEEMAEAASALMRGRPPYDLWYSLAELKGARVGGAEMRGMMSFGLKVFCDREVELAPAPVTPVTAHALSRIVAERLLTGELVEDREPLAHEALEEPAVIRLADRFMRPRQQVVLLVLPGATINSETLEPKRQVGAARGGLVSRLFGSGGRR